MKKPFAKINKDNIVQLSNIKNAAYVVFNKYNKKNYVYNLLVKNGEVILMTFPSLNLVSIFNNGFTMDINYFLSNSHTKYYVEFDGNDIIKLKENIKELDKICKTNNYSIYDKNLDKIKKCINNLNRKENDISA